MKNWKSIDFNNYPQEIYLESKGERNFKYKREVNIKEVKEIFILENFYDQLSPIIVSIIIYIYEKEEVFEKLTKKKAKELNFPFFHLSSLKKIIFWVNYLVNQIIITLILITF